MANDEYPSLAQPSPLRAVPTLASTTTSEPQPAASEAALRAVLLEHEFHDDARFGEDSCDGCDWLRDWVGKPYGWEAWVDHVLAILAARAAAGGGPMADVLHITRCGRHALRSDESGPSGECAPCREAGYRLAALERVAQAAREIDARWLARWPGTHSAMTAPLAELAALDALGEVNGA